MVNKNLQKDHNNVADALLLAVPREKIPMFCL